MVMHARKPQRINDGYFEKHQAHPYQNSKYGSSKGGYGGDRYGERGLRDSPNGNSYRSEGEECLSPRERDRDRDRSERERDRERERERAYSSKSTYLQKVREKERENRDYKVCRDKYVGECRSPKEAKRAKEEHRTNHDRVEDKLLHPAKLASSSAACSSSRKPQHNCQDKREERNERVTRVGDWSEHISSSGKKYYYNCKTEVSQWEKPREWVERERERDCRFRVSSGSGKDSVPYGRGHDKHSSSSGSRGGAARDKGGGRHSWSSNSREESTVTETTHDPRRAKHDGELSTQQDMDISPGDSTPTSEISYHTPSTSRGAADGPPATPGLEPDSLGTPTVSGAPVGPVLLAQALPRITQQPEQQTPGGISTPAMVPPPCSTGNTANTPGPPVSLSALPRLAMMGAQPQVCGKEPQVSRQASLPPQVVPQTPDCSVLEATQPTEGPPTPTHSESQDCVDARKSLATVTSPPASLSTLQGITALRSTSSTITPSLSNYYRDDLVNHVRGWPADILEKQAQKLSEEAHVMGSLQCTKVSAELKSARSIVRLTEIQATLQEQRILFLRQQIKMLEDMKAQNSFMSDDS